MLVRSPTLTNSESSSTVSGSSPDSRSAGSFFTNPVVDDAELAALVARLGDVDVPGHPDGPGRTKLSAAWLIDRAGFAKGYPGSGRATLSTKHTLALTNRGEATAADIVDLARTIRDGVRDAFDVELVPEPVWIGLSLDE